MRKPHFIFIGVLLLIAISSCVSSLYPISENKNDFVFKEELLGVWGERDGGTRYIVQKAGIKNYNITVIDKIEPGSKKNDTSYFLGTLARLNNQYFLDCIVDIENPQFRHVGDNTRSAILPLHLIYKIRSIEKNQLNIAAMNIDSLKKIIAGNENYIRHEKLDKDNILLTARPGEVQKKILLSKMTGFIFSESSLLTRIK